LKCCFAKVYLHFHLKQGRALDRFVHSESVLFNLFSGLLNQSQSVSIMFQ